MIFTSMPGTSGLLTPFGKIKGLCFDDSPEVEEFFYNLDNDLAEFNKQHSVNYIKIDCEDPRDYYKIINSIHKMNKEGISVQGTSREGEMSVIIESEESVDKSEDNTSEE